MNITRDMADTAAHSVQISDIRQMLQDAADYKTNWTDRCRVNHGMTFGASFNIYTAGSIDENTHHIARVNMIWDFGEYLPFLRDRPQPPPPMHQEPKLEGWAIPMEEFKMEPFRAIGQPVNAGDVGVRITHLPTGIYEDSTGTRNYSQNVVQTLKIIRKKIRDAER